MLATLFNVLLIILGFTLLIFVHELGHFVAAKWAGIRTQAFAIFMGNVVLAWRKGVGFTVGSTAKRVKARTGKYPDELNDEELSHHGIGETEYSLRAFPLGGFVKMLGQEDANPNAVSDDPRSYNRCPIGKRMIVVSAGVVMNLVLAVLLFMISFLIGFQSEAPVVGEVAPDGPAAAVWPERAEALGITERGLMAGDRVVSVGGTHIETFGDLAVETAMARPDVPLAIRVDRPGVEEILSFAIVPSHDDFTGLLGIGINSPARSTRLYDADPEGTVEWLLTIAGVADDGVRPGMQLVSVNDQTVGTQQAFMRLIDESGGRPVVTRWSTVDEEGHPAGSEIEATIHPAPEFQQMIYNTAAGLNYDAGLFGLSPLTLVERVTPDDPADGILEEGDILLSVAGEPAPRPTQVRTLIETNRGREIQLVVLRGGQEVSLTATVSGEGKLGFLPGIAPGSPRIAQPVLEVVAEESLVGGSDADEIAPSTPTPVTELNLVPGSTIAAVGEAPVADWPGIRAAMIDQTMLAFQNGSGATIEMTFLIPPKNAVREVAEIELSAADVKSLHELGWTTRLTAFQPIYVTLSADGDPIRAVGMGFDRTWRFVEHVYLTIDRLIRGSVGVEQLRGPVGIVHIGTQIADRELMYLLFFLGIISVNLAVINFLPIPIVDGGLFLFLIYEKFRGRPPSIAFQNAATLAGLALIGTVLVVTLYNDMMRLVFG